MKCSRGDSMTILGLLKVTLCDKIYLSVFEEMKNPKWKMNHIWYVLLLMTKSI